MLTDKITNIWNSLAQPFKTRRFRNTLDNYISNIGSINVNKVKENPFFEDMDKKKEEETLNPVLNMYSSYPQHRTSFDGVIIDYIAELFRKNKSETASELVKKLGDNAPDASAVTEKMNQTCKNLLDNPDYMFRNRQLNYAARRGVSEDILSLMMTRIKADIIHDSHTLYGK